MTQPPDPQREGQAEERVQGLRLRRTAYALAAGVVMTLLFATLQHRGLTRLDGGGFALLVATFWAGNLAFPAVIASGLNLRLADPSLTMAQILWATTASFAMVYFALDGRHLLIMIYLLSMMFGTFRLRPGQFLAVTLYALVLYGVCIVTLERDHPQRTAPYGEFLEWLVLYAVMIGFTLMGSELSRLRARLERRNRDLAQARDEAERASHARSRFLAATSDELRTPLTTILGATDVVDLGRLGAAERDALERAHHAGGYLLSLVNSMIDGTHLDAGTLELREGAMDLRRELEQATSMLRPLAEAQGVTLDLDAPRGERVTGDAMRLKEVLAHLLRNAVRATHRTTVRLAAARDAAEAERVAFTISLDGGGEPGSAQGEDGLALTLCAQLVERMGGTLEVDTTPRAAHRFRFSLTLPRVPQDEPSAEPRARLPRVLLVDDSEDNRLLIRAFLGDSVATLDEAVDGVEGVARFRDGDYDVVLMDMHMPRMGGIEATRAIRDAERGRGDDKTARVLALTADDSVNDRARSLAAGCDDHLVKPITKKALVEAVAAWRGTGVAG